MSASVAVWDLWSEAAKESESLGDPVFLECLEAASGSRIFDDLTDDKLKASLSIINSLLNDPKTRPKGLTLLNELLVQINPTRLIGFQESVISALHLVVKGLDSSLANTVLVNFIPKCHAMSEVNQSVTASIIPKILAYFCEDSSDSSTQRSIEEIMLLKVCLEEYHGPCGQFRDKLEKVLTPLVDSENEDFVELLGEVVPLLSYAGGGGSAGEKHTKDWNTMITKFLKTAYTTLYQLYGDNCPTLEPENPFEGEQLSGLKRISESKVLLRMSVLKRRLQSLLRIISGYLKMSFPAPKLVPQKGILKLIEYLTYVNPVATFHTESATFSKENIFLSAIVPGLHITSLDLLKSLLTCVGTNIFSDAISVEQIISGELKWIQERPKAFEVLKQQIYETLITWVRLSGGIVTNLKTLGIWVSAVGSDTCVEKDVVELKSIAKPKSGKSVKLKSSSPLSFGISTSTQTFVQKNPQVCEVALRALIYLIPSLDKDNHRKIYEHLVKTVSIINQYQSPPSPYCDPHCRKLVYESLSFLSFHPQPRSPVSLPLIVTLFSKGIQDPTKLVSSFCSSQISKIERLMHPISAPLSTEYHIAAPVPVDNNIIPNRFTEQSTENSNFDDTDEESEIEEMSSGVEHCQTVNQNVRSEEIIVANPEVLNSDNLRNMIKEAVEKTLINILPSTLTGTQSISLAAAVAKNSSSSRFGYYQKPTTVDEADSSNHDNEVELEGDNDSEVIEHNLTNGNSCTGGGDAIQNETEINFKRKANSSELDAVQEIEFQSKKVKTQSPVKPTVVDGPSVDEMLSSFVDM